MNDAIARLNLDVQDMSAHAVVNMKQGDTARQIHITLSDAGFPYQISDGCTARLRAVKSDGTKLDNLCEIDGNTIIYKCTTQTATAPGTVLCDVRLTGADDAFLTSARFRILVDAALNDDLPVSEDQVTALNDLISQASASWDHAKNVADKLLERAEAGEFNGEKGDKGDPGQTGAMGPAGPEGAPGWGSTEQERIEFSRQIIRTDGGLPTQYTQAQFREREPIRLLDEDDLNLLNGDLSHKLTEPDGMAAGKYFRIAAIDENGHAVLEAVDLPAASSTVLGGIKVNSNDGMYVQDGFLKANSTSKTGYPYLTNSAVIAKGTLQNVLAAPSIMPALTEAEQLAGRQRLGLDKEWVLMGTLTTDNMSEGVAVDLSGYTELIIRGTTTGTGYSNLMFNDYNSAVYRIFANSSYYHEYYWVDVFGSAICVSGAYIGGTETNPRSLQHNTNGYNMMRGLKVSGITNIKFNNPSVGTACSLEIYAR